MHRIALLGLVVVAGCYRPDLGECSVTCGPGIVCPDGTTCDLAEGFCQSDVAETCDGGTELYAAVALGDAHTCALRDDHTLWCFGNDDSGALGDGGTGRKATPQQVEGDDWLAIGAGEIHTCGIHGAALPGTVACWGSNNAGRVDENGGVEEYPEPHDLDLGGHLAARLTVGAATNCAIDDDAHLWCWGVDYYGQTGAGHPSGGDPIAPTQIGAETWRDVSAGYYHTCGIQADGTLWCWGSQSDFKLLGTGDDLDHLTPAQVVTGENDDDWVQVSVADHFSCGIRDDAGVRTMWCWGRDAGTFGDGRGAVVSEYEPTPVQAADGDDWTLVRAGGLHTCGIRGTDQLFCWGHAPHGEVGVGDRAIHAMPEAIDGAWIDVALGWDDACARRDDGAVFCWGSDLAGQLGDGAFAVEPAPVQVGALAGWTALALGGDTACGLRGDELSCWGSNDYAQRGLVVTDPGGVAPNLVAGAWTAASTGDSHTCGANGTGDLSCWGDDDIGQLGNNTTSAPVAAPQPVSAGPATWEQLAMSDDYGCGIGGGQLWCWGTNLEGQLGQPLATSSADQPMRVGAASDWIAVAVSGSATCGIQDGGSTRTLSCWGSNGKAQLGRDLDATALPLDPAPAPVAGAVTDWAGVSGGGETFCAWTVAQAMWCWGNNDFGKLGNGDGDTVLAPVQPSGPSAWLDAASGSSFTCMIDAQHQIWCTGSDGLGVLGDGDVSESSRVVPTKVGGDTDWEDLAAGDNHVCARKTDGTTWCWGYNGLGQVGAGEADTLAPRRILDP